MDRDEGKKKTIAKIKGSFDKKSIEEHLILKDGSYSLGQGGKLIIGDGVTHVENKESIDFSVLCLSSRFDESLFAEFKSDCCILIRSPKKFFNYLNREMMGLGFESGNINKCVYNDRKEYYDGGLGVHEVFCKGVKYKHQKEWRLAWKQPGSMKKTEDKSRIIVCGRVSRVVEPYASILFA